DAGPDDPAADHEDIEDGLLHLREVGGPRSGGELTRHRDRSMIGPGFVMSFGSSSRLPFSKPEEDRSAFEGDAPIVPAPARGSEGPRLHEIRRIATPDKDVPSSRRRGPKALRTRRICDSYRCGMIDREAIVEVLERYNPSGIQVATIGSHSALDVCDGAVEEGFRTFVVCERGRIPGPALREPHPAPDGGARGGTQLLLAPREGEARGARADR